jgi:nucleoid-associated protein EbfC
LILNIDQLSETLDKLKIRNMFGGMMNKMKEAQEKMQEIKERLDQVSVKGEAGNGKVVVIVSASKKVKEINIDPEFHKASEAEEMEDMIMLAMGDAMVKAENVAESESKGALGGILPNIPGLNF